MDRRITSAIILLMLANACAAQLGGLEISKYELVPEVGKDIVVAGTEYESVKITYLCPEVPNCNLPATVIRCDAVSPQREIYFGVGDDLSSVGWTMVPIAITTSSTCSDTDLKSKCINCVDCTIEAKAQLPAYPYVYKVPASPGQFLYLKVQGTGSAGLCYGVIVLGLIKSTDAPEEPPVGGPIFAGEQDFICGAYTAGSGFPGCDYGYNFGCAAGGNPMVRCSSCIDCRAACGRACGESTTCMALGVADVDTQCTDCCGTTTCNKGGPWTYDPYFLCGFLSLSVLKDALVEEVCACNRACIGNCKANTEFCNTINLLRTMAGAIAAMLLVIHLIRLMFADDPKNRADIKQAIWFVFIGALIILVASYLVSYLYGSTAGVTLAC